MQLCISIFSQHKYITSEFQMGCKELQKFVIMSLYQTFTSPLLLKRNNPHFTTTPYLCHYFLVVPTFARSWEFNTGF